MPRDYKNINKQANKAGKKQTTSFGNLLSFITGLSIGLLIAAYFYLEANLPQGISDTLVTDNNAAEDNTQDQEKDLPTPKFEFYNILKNRKLNVYAITDEPEAGNTVSDQPSIYLLQIGSFKEYQAADQLKAQLALIGISATITSVVINDYDIRHRVRVGPFDDPEQLKLTRRRLEENDYNNYMILKLEVEETQG